MLVVDVAGRSDELKCAAFMFLKVSLSTTLCHGPLADPGGPIRPWLPHSGHGPPSSKTVWP